MLFVICFYYFICSLGFSLSYLCLAGLAASPIEVFIFVICYLLFVICYLLFVICYLLFVICYLLLFVICSLFFVLCSLFFVLCYLFFVLCYLLFGCLKCVLLVLLILQLRMVC